MAQETETLTLDDLSFIKESLEYTKHKFENYTDYPSQEFKKQRVKDVRIVAAKVNGLIKAMKQSK